MGSGPSDDDTGTLLKHSSPKGRSSFLGPLTRRMPDGWRFGVTVGVALSLCTLITNIVVLAVASAIASRNGHHSNIATIRTGPCSDIDHIQFGIHLAINAVSTLLLGASNYCMQCLSAPTREDIDRAHGQGKWLDIGVPSMKNFSHIKSIKLLFCYNSTFFVSTANNSYDVYFATEDFQKGASFDSNTFPPYSDFTDSTNFIVGLEDGTTEVRTASYLNIDERHDPYSIQSKMENLGVWNNGSLFERRNNSDCIQDYAKTPLSDRRNVILVTSTLPSDNQEMGVTAERAGMASSCEKNSPSFAIVSSGDNRLVSCDANSSLLSVYPYTSNIIPAGAPVLDNWYNWICSQDVEYDNYGSDRPASLCGDGYWQDMRSSASDWKVWGFKIEYCISEKMENGCSLNVAKSLMIVVILANTVKVVVLTIVIVKVKDSPLTTIGDAAASFIRKRDTTTRGMCLLTQRDFAHGYINAARLSGQPPAPKTYRTRKNRAATATGKTRWVITGSLAILCIVIILSLLAYALSQLRSKFGRSGLSFIKELGLGKTTPYNMITGWHIPSSGDAAVVATVLIANLPQLLLSFIYFFLNGLITKLSLAKEWSAYAHRRAALRVSHPRGSQRGTYFLQVPYRVGVPLMLFSGVLHLIISQSIFFVKVDGRDAHGADGDDDASLNAATSAVTCGFSPLGMILTVVAAAVLSVFTVALGLRRLRPGGMPLAGSCSAAIAAACHGPEGTDECRPVMWGVVPGEEEEVVEMEDGEVIGHCAFSNGTVDAPVDGRMYA
ncbi:hypothetical protein DIS24_g11536 [Lasiodiplodia hormozganensis]|uniref:DUF6536 domain-containing protein n=1 Tax=Lasiodiplodia hormozganensis TaxID=869390 RepID=A0AA39WNP2_9PEZI|nr:hypothetical protein DIS24_g11536 [Lasiodiplodia hormozganensis]